MGYDEMLEDDEAEDSETDPGLVERYEAWESAQDTAEKAKAFKELIHYCQEDYGPSESDEDDDKGAKPLLALAFGSPKKKKG